MKQRLILSLTALILQLLTWQQLQQQGVRAFEQGGGSGDSGNDHDPPGSRHTASVYLD